MTGAVTYLRTSYQRHYSICEKKNYTLSLILNPEIPDVTTQEVITIRSKVIVQITIRIRPKIDQFLGFTPLWPIHQSTSHIRVQIVDEREIIPSNRPRGIVRKNTEEYLDYIRGMERAHDRSAVVVCGKVGPRRYIGVDLADWLASCRP